jgi:hypothetical protein
MVEQSRLDGSFLKAYSVTWRANRYDADGQELSSFTVDEWYEILSEEGADLFKMIQVWNDSSGTPLFTSVRVSDRRTMEYVSFHTGAAPGGFGHLDIEEGFVSGFYAPAPEKQIRSFSLFLSERPFASMSGVLFAPFPLEAGAELVYPGFGWGGMSNPTVRWIRWALLAICSIGHHDIRLIAIRPWRPPRPTSIGRGFAPLGSLQKRVAT